MGALAEEFPDLKTLFQADAGIEEGYTIQQHTRIVYDLYESHKKTFLPSIKVPKDVDLDKLLPAIIALHDIGKPEAIAKGVKHLQHQ